MQTHFGNESYREFGIGCYVERARNEASGRMGEEEPSEEVTSEVTSEFQPEVEEGVTLSGKITTNKRKVQREERTWPIVQMERRPAGN